MRGFQVHLSTLLGLAATSLAALDGSRYLWYDTPAIEWERGVMPIGNGRLGASIYGSLDEVITINENSIWDGPLQNRTPTGALTALPKVRQLLLNGKYTEASDLVLAQMNQPSELKAERQYSYFGNLNLAFGHNLNGAKNYTRWLDTRQGNSGVEYTFNGVNYKREYIASFPSGVLATRFTASKQGALNLEATFSRLAGIVSNTASTSGTFPALTLSGNSGQPANQNPIQFTGEARFVVKDGQVSASANKLVIKGATTIDVFFDAETSYRFSSQDDLKKAIDRKLQAAIGKGYDKVKEEAILDSKSLIERASIDLGKSPAGLADLPTDKRVKSARSDTRDVQLNTLLWNYGRHMLIASSRNTDAAIDLPANLQGIWNNKTSASWGGKFTINENTEMNYWPAGQTNLIETQLPLFDLMQLALPRGKKLAKDMYNCDGVVFFHNLDLWGDPAPTDKFRTSSQWPMGAAWLVQHMVDQYRFTGDKAFLQSVVWPFINDVAAFYYCSTFAWEGHQVVGPSLSPENSFKVPSNGTTAGAAEPIDIAVSMDNQLMRELMTSLFEIATVLNIPDTDTNVQKAKSFFPKIRPQQIGSLGQLLEWRYEYQETELGHRHISHLYGLYPGTEFSPLANKTLSAAALISLNRRRDNNGGGTGWSRAHMICAYTRLFRGADAWSQIQGWWKTFPTENLWNTDNGRNFQIEGNWGVTAGLTEMVLQSTNGVVHVLPALPRDAVPKGSAKGLRARGVFEVDVEWEGGKLKVANVTAVVGGRLEVRVGDGEGFLVDGRKYAGPVETKVGDRLVVTLA